MGKWGGGGVSEFIVLVLFRYKIFKNIVMFWIFFVQEIKVIVGFVFISVLCNYFLVLFRYVIWKKSFGYFL